MKPWKISINSSKDLRDKIEGFHNAHPGTKLDEQSLSKAQAAAMRLDNETIPPHGAGGRMNLEILIHEPT